MYIDGEMPLSMMKERMGKIVADNQSNNDCIYFINPDTQENGISNLATTKGQQEVDVHIKDYDLIILDNLSTLLRSGKENEGESWLPIQEWALRHRSKGKSMVFIHHAGKSGQQRGTSRREDALDTVIALKRPSDYKSDQGARFEVHFEKARGLYGEDLEPIECNLSTDTKGNLSWTHRTIEESTHQKVINMYKEGLNQTEITQELDVNKSVVSRHLKRAREQDELSI